ncbi:GntR family transcriptional regulator [Variovorax guangxiensis]|uniref:GntR family transcriptional regulator n=1 Tax=Variovorax guangxiensis TaxID=1775474 RepID=UPI00286216D8|nr:GntR family transcriptional regulator [Variovorax guangxiensis]MDR6861029.1 DNA-binding GntR family transcriptional regulator [Variovorax guangxiensis]
MAKATVSATEELAGAASVDEISDKILGAVWEHRLPPGTKLVEEKLAGVFGVSRTKIRLALGKLSHDGILTVEPNRGTFVSSPSVAEARQVFNARRVLEPALMRELCAVPLRREQLARLRKNIALESEARTRNDRRAIIRLSGEFHTLIAEVAQNPYLGKYMRELCSLTCLVIALYDAPGMPACPHHEHTAIVDALEARDADKACALMVEHLTHVENTLRLEMPVGEDIDFEAVFS